jgi:hypothetical protein
MIENVSHKDKESNDIMYLAERHLLNRHGSCGSLRYQRSYPASCPVCWQGPDSYRDVPVASWYGAIFAPDSYRDTVRAGFCAIAVQVDGY